MTRTNRVLTSVLVLALALTAGCRAEDGLRLRALREVEPPPVAPAPPPEPRRTRVTVNYCSTPTEFKRTRTRVLYVMDRSGSNLWGPSDAAGTDMDGLRRFGALSQYLQSSEVLALGTDIEFGLLYFSSSDVYPAAQMDRAQMRFARSFVAPADLLTVVQAERPQRQGTPPNQSQVTGGGRTIDAGWTDYLTALSRAYDVVNTAEVARAASGDASEIVYLVAFISDGAPLVAPPGGEPAMQGNADIMAAVDRLTGLAFRHSRVVGVMLHTAYYTEGTPRLEPICFGNRPCLPFDLLTEMAQAGGGEAQRVEDNRPVDFSRFRIPDQRLRYQPLQVFVENTNAVWETGEVKVDADADGLSDEFEERVGMDPSNPVGLAGTTPGLEQVGDRVAHYACRTALAACASRCGALPAAQRFDDPDADGLNRCEETLLGSDPDRGDSIARGIPDRLAFLRELGRIAGSGAPAGDADFDGIDNITEVRDFTPLNFRNAMIPDLKPFRYSAALLPSPTGALNECFRLLVDDVRLVLPQDQDRLRAYLVEEPSLFRSGRVIRTDTRTAAESAPLQIGVRVIGGSP